ncbi:MAG TPA: ABC transporter substrate-binding protein [Candidatus Acidoferrales bacterium]|nr:ABC transporter substrate-binding protein [Candidatus Acidoferrales bacterium]
MTHLSFYAAEDKGFFEREGVKVRCLHSHDEPQAVVRLMMAGEVAFYATIVAAVEAALHGWGELRALCATMLSKAPCAARAEIKSLADLKGKKVMVGGGRSYNELLWLCRYYGWQPEKDIEVVRGELSDRVEAFRDPSVAAVFGRPQYLFWLKEGGFHLLPYPENRAWAEAGLTTSLRLVREQPDTVQRVVNAIVGATEFLKQNRDQAVEIAVKYVPYLTREAAEGNYEVMREWYSYDISESAIAHQAEVFGMAKNAFRPLKLDEVADLSFLHEALRQISVATR